MHWHRLLERDENGRRRVAVGWAGRLRPLLPPMHMGDTAKYYRGRCFRKDITRKLPNLDPVFLGVCPLLPTLLAFVPGVFVIREIGVDVDAVRSM